MRQIPILVLICLFASLQILAKDSYNDVVTQIPVPSDKTWSDIEQTNNNPNLRQAPWEDGTAQKEVEDEIEVPLSSPSLANIVIILIILLIYNARHGRLTLLNKK